MTPKQELEKLRELGFDPIKPFKLNEMSKTATKIVNFTIDEGKGQREP